MNDNTCGAKTRSGGKCKRSPMKNGRCNLHGGKSLKGAESPTFKHGKRSKYLPQRIVNIYEDMVEDGDYRDLYDNIRLREAFMREKLQMLDDAPDSAKVWSDFRKLWDGIKKAFANENYGEVLAAIHTGDMLIDERLVYFETQKEIRADLAEQRKDYQAIASIQYKGENAASMAELTTFVGALLHIVAKHTPKATQSAIFNDVNNLISANPSNQARIKRLSE